MMRIVFTDLFKDECQQRFRIWNKHVRYAILQPDAVGTVELDDQVLGFFVKRESDIPDSSYLIICCRRSADGWFVDLAFRLSSDLVSEAGTLDPLILLQGFAQRFGLFLQIGNHYNKFVFREDIPVDEDQADATQIVGIRNPYNHAFVASTYIKVEQTERRRVAKVAIAYCIDIDEYLHSLFGQTSEAGRTQGDVLIEIAPQIAGVITPRDLITPQGTLEFRTNYSQIGGENTGHLFRLSSPGYSLEIGFTQTHFYITRNKHRLEALIQPAFCPLGDVHCFAFWSPNELGLLMLDETYQEAASAVTRPDQEISEIARRRHILQTSITIPPAALIDWARREAIVPVTTYESVIDFNQVIISSLQTIQDKVSSIGMHNPFWDITYEGRRIIGRQPKSETDIHPIIHGLLFDIAIAKNFHIVPEYAIAGGNLDFLMSGTLVSGRQAYTCVEFKHAHSEAIEDGLLKQLPAYMRAKGTDHGIYAVMYFKGRDFSRPTHYDRQELKLHLEVIRRKTGLSNIRLLILDFSYPLPPSRL